MKLNKNGLRYVGELLGISDNIDSNFLDIIQSNGRQYIEYTYITKPKALAGFISKPLTKRQSKELQKHKLKD